MVSWNLVLAVGLLVALSQIGISLAPLLAGFGVVGFILGFAMQDSLGNLAAGMMILINRPYDVGDMVEISGVFGKVENMSMVSTSVLTIDNQKLVVPNSKIWGDVIKNVTDQRIRRVDMVFGISYDDDAQKAIDTIQEALQNIPEIVADPAPQIGIEEFADSSVNIGMRYWVPTKQYFQTLYQANLSVYTALERAGITIPFPQRDIHMSTGDQN